MVDDLRRELIQVIRRCDEIVLRQPEINKILNGKYKEVIEDYEKEPKNLDEVALAPNLVGEPEQQPQPKSSTMVEDTNDESEPVCPDDEQEVPSLSDYRSEKLEDE